MLLKLAVVTTHPVQYYAPLFTQLALGCNLMVFYTWGKDSVKKFDPGFGKVIEWDLPLLEGYPHQFLENTSKKPGSNHFKGIINPDLIQQLEDFKPKAILVIGYAYHSHLKVMRHFKSKIPIWFRGDSNLLDPMPSWKRLLKSIYLKWVYQKVDLAFYVGTANKAYFKKYGLKEKQLIFAPHAIDNSRFEIEREEEAKALRKKLGVKPSDYMILFAGKFETKKNPELLLSAFVALNDPQTHLLFVGNGQLEAPLKAESKDHGYRVSFLDFLNQTEIPVAYQACDIFCLPSNGPGETWGLAVNEAMASGKAILVSDKVGCAQDLISENGFIFKAGNLKDLTEKLSKLMQLDLKMMGKKSKNIIQNWTIEKQATVLLQMLNEKTA